MQETVYSESPNLFKNVLRAAIARHFWNMRSTKCARDCSESLLSPKNAENWGGQAGAGFVCTPIISSPKSIRWCVETMRVCNHLWRNAPARLCGGEQCWCCDARLQLDVAKCTVLAAREEELGCRSNRRLEQAGKAEQKRAREEVAQITGCSDQRRSHTVKK